MPGIFRLSCQRCSYAVSGIMSVMTVVLDDGTEKVCPHPCERLDAEEATGGRWSELTRTNRLVYRHALVCLECGELDYYGRRDLTADARAASHVAGIVHQSSRHEASLYTCRACGQRSLYPLCGQTGCLIGLAKLVGLIREQVQCPRCRQGTLRSEIIAIS